MHEGIEKILITEEAIQKRVGVIAREVGEGFPDVSGRCVLLVDDILDTGRTLEAVSVCLLERGGREVKTCVLLTKRKDRDFDIKADYSAFEIEDKFVVGYGLDYDERYRKLPYVGVLKADVI